MEIAKFILTTIGTFISVSGLFFAIFQYWVKKREEKDTAFRASVRADMESECRQSIEEIQRERNERNDDLKDLEKRIERLEVLLTGELIGKISKLEGEMKGMRITLEAIQNWFISNSPSGGK